MLEELERAAELGLLRHIDIYFAQHMAKLNGHGDPVLPLMAALVSHRTGAGDICLDLASVEGTVLKDEASGFGIEIPKLDPIRTSLHASPIVGSPGQIAPLIMDGRARLYLGRYWWFEQQVADSLLARATFAEEIDQGLLIDALQQGFKERSDATDWQKIAAALAVLRRFAVISGGPGTGKTHTVTTILALLIGQANSTLRIALAAPTGKAATRLTESIRQAKPSLPCGGEIKAAIPEEATTLHRLLGIRPGRSEPRHTADNPLRLDLLVVDEASMVDLPLMARLLAAMPESARLILLGDKDQLASVEAGSVFADICGNHSGVNYTTDLRARLEACTEEAIPAGEPGNSFSDSIALLQKSYRFSGNKGIGSLAQAINSGDAGGALALLKSGRDDISLRNPSTGSIHLEIARKALDGYRECFSTDGPGEALGHFNTFRVLCAVRGGPGGVEQVNQTMEQVLRAKGCIHGEGLHYRGRPIMIRRNDYGVGLFNGDMGILWPDPEAGNSLRAWFEMPDHTMKRVLPSRLPEHETAYAMTVHKSQGSEFDQVLLILPFDEVAMVTRELIYTGITRARIGVEIWGSDEIFTKAVQGRIQRTSGLGDRLYPDG
ncbi:MAG: exodeoxyribonuclease V subunit alpha [Gammaproteobacteria bacterium]|nr:exodeoxyribonuclease V subunit alpha [Gammaproteobacteria bacterium]